MSTARDDPDRDSVYAADAFLTSASLPRKDKPPVSDLGHKHFELDSDGKGYLSRNGDFSATAVSRYIDELRERLAPRFQVPESIRVRGVRGSTSTCYAPDGNGNIDIHMAADVRRLGGIALEAVVLHEIAHSLLPPEVHHGPAFRETYAALLAEMLGADVAGQFERNFSGKPDETAEPSDGTAELIAEVRAGLDDMDRSHRRIGKALHELRAGPKAGLSKKAWDAWLKDTFSGRMSQATASKLITLAMYQAPEMPPGDSIWNHLPPRWTSQYAVLSFKLTPDQLAWKASRQARSSWRQCARSDITRVIGEITGEYPPADDIVSIAVRESSPILAIWRAHKGLAALTPDQVNAVAALLNGILTDDQRDQAVRDLLRG